MKREKEEQKENVIKKLRKKDGISRNTLCEGLCTENTVWRLENRESTPDRIISERLLQRLGKSTDRLENLMSKNEYMAFCHWEKTEEAIFCFDYETAEQKLKQYKKATEKGNKLYQQYAYMAEAIIALEGKQDKTEGIRCLIKAVEITMPNWRKFGGNGQDSGWERYFLGAEELHLLLLLAEAYMDTEEKKEAEKLLNWVLFYLENRHLDEDEQLKVYPKCAYLLGILWEEAGNYQDGMVLCERALKLLTDHGSLYYLSEILKFIAEGLRKEGERARERRLENQRRSLLELYVEYGNIQEKDAERMKLTNTQREIYLWNEMLHAERRMQKIQQKKLAEKLYIPQEVLSKLESGKKSPSLKQMELLLEWMKLDKDRYNIGAEPLKDLELNEKRRQINRMVAQHEDERAEEVIQELRRELDMEIPENKQYILSTEAILNLDLGYLAPAEAIGFCKEALSFTFQMPDQTKEVCRVPTDQEAVILNTIAVCLKHSGKRKEGIELLERILELYEKSEVDTRYHYTAVSRLLSNLSSWYGDEGAFQKAEDACDKGTQLSLVCGRGEKIHIYLTNKAGILEKRKEKAAVGCFRQAFHLSDLMKNYKDKYIIKRHCEEHFVPLK